MRERGQTVATPATPKYVSSKYRCFYDMFNFACTDVFMTRLILFVVVVHKHRFCIRNKHGPAKQVPMIHVEVTFDKSVELKNGIHIKAIDGNTMVLEDV